MRIISSIFFALLVSNSVLAFDVLSRDKNDPRYIKVTLIFDNEGKPQRVGFCLQESLYSCRELGKYHSYSIEELKKQRKIEFAKMTGKGAAVVTTGLLGGLAVGGGAYGAAYFILQGAGVDLVPSAASLAIPIVLGGATATYVGSSWYSVIDPVSNFKKARILRDDVITDVNVTEDINSAVNLLEEVLYSMDQK